MIATVYSNTQPTTFAIDKIADGVAKFAIRTNITQVPTTDPVTGTPTEQWQYSETQMVVTADTGEDIDLMRSARGVLLANVDYLTTRYLEQSALVTGDALTATTMTAAQYQALLVYKQGLRDLPHNFTTLAAIVWPEPPAGINP